MLKSNLLEVIKTFSPKEMREFGEFIKSPFFNKNKKVTSLFELIRKYYPELNTEKLNKESVFAKLFPGKKYKDSTIRLLMFYLYEAVEQFLVYNRHVANRFEYKLSLLGEFNDRNLLKEFEKSYEETKKILKETTLRDEDYYRNVFLLGNEHFEYLSKVYIDKYDKYFSPEKIEERFNNLTYSYIIRFLKFYATTLTTLHILNIEFKTDIYENMLGNLNPDLFEDVPLVKIYYCAVMALLKPEEEHYYFDQKKLILKHELIIDRSTLEDLFIHLENYCTRKVRTGNYSFIDENFDLYKLELEKRICMNNGYISPLFYTNIVNVGLSLKQVEYLHWFVDEHKKDLREDMRDSVYYYSLALIETEERKFEKALTTLSKVKTDEIYAKLDVRMLQCRLYYELNWNDSLTSLLDTFRRTIANNKLIPELRKTHYAKFVKYLGKLESLKNDSDELDIEQLRKQMENDEHYHYKKWLFNRLDEMEERMSHKH